MDLTDEQRAAIDRLQREHGTDATPDERKRFMKAIVSVPKEELEGSPPPPKEKRGRKPKGPIPTNVQAPGVGA